MINKCLYKMKKDIKNIPLSTTGEMNDLPRLFPEGGGETFPLQTELKKILELSLEKLPESYRMVFLLRETQNFSVAETAEALNITPLNVKVRLNRAKAMMRDHLEQWYSKTEIYEFNLTYCSKVVDQVFKKISLPT
jgi:RNA polymerase sigma factor (sigma-70 family)